jgi:hypothetical protein
MDRYNFRITSLSPAQLTAELSKHGAQTFGSPQRRQQRLQRFIDDKKQRGLDRVRREHTEARLQDRLQRFIDAEDRRVQARHDKERQALRTTILAGSKRSAPEPELRRSSRISELVSQYLGY